MTDIEKRVPEEVINEGGGLEALFKRATDLNRQRTELEESESSLLADFKRKLEPTMLEVVPGLYVIIKPSRRNGVVSVGSYRRGTGQLELNFKNEAGKLTPLVESEDYIFFNENGPLQTSDIENPFISQVVDELE